MNPSRILFFIAGNNPTDAEKAAAAKLGTKAFRNASQISMTDAPEQAVAVAGLVPRHYFKDNGQPIHFGGVEVIIYSDAPAAPETPAPVLETHAPLVPAPEAPVVTPPVPAVVPPVPPVAPPVPPVLVVEVDESSTVAAIREELARHEIAVPASAKTKAQLIALFPQ